MSTPRIAFFDVENAPSLGYFWGKTWETNIIKVNAPWYMLCFSYKWLGKSKIHTHSLREYPHYKKNLQDDYHLIKSLHQLFDEADLLVAHNGKRFDVRKSNARFIKHKLLPPSPYRVIDTLLTARQHFEFESNRLGDLAQFLGIGKKLTHTGFDMWERVMAGDSHAWDHMERYNRKDISLLEDVYLRLRPYMLNHPNLEVYSESGCCPTCQSHNTYHAGTRVSRTRKYQRIHCRNCGSWFQGDLIKREA